MSGTVAVTGCTIESSAEEGTTTTATAAPRATPLASEPPSSAESPDWSDQASATASLAAFIEELASADLYHVDRIERATFGGEYLDTTVATVVDVAQDRVQSTQSLAVSHPLLWEYLAEERGEELERLKWLRTQMVVDFGAGDPDAYMTFLGPYGWDGQWLLLDAENIDDVAEADIPADWMERVGIDGPAAAIRELIALKPEAFDPASSTLEYDLPTDAAALWVPESLLLGLESEGSKLSELTSPVRVRVTPMSGGVEGVLDLSALVDEVNRLFTDPEDLDEVTDMSMTVTVRLFGIGSGTPVRLPAPASVVSDPPVS